MEKGRNALAHAIAYGGTIAGVLDAGNGVLYNYIANNLNPVQVLQYISSGFYGKSAFDMGYLSAAVGVGAHFFIAFVLAAIYTTATLVAPALHRGAMILGPLFGAAVFLVMNFGVLPLTNVVATAITPAFLINGLIGHALLVGLPIALCARHAFGPTAARAQ